MRRFKTVSRVSALPAGSPGRRANSGRHARTYYEQHPNPSAKLVPARPLRYLELRARLRALLRRAVGSNQQTGPLQIGPLTIDQAAHAVSLADKRLDLRPLEYELLLHLAGDPQRVFYKHELLKAVWGYRSLGTTRTVDSHASRLRRKLSLDPPVGWVVSVRG